MYRHYKDFTAYRDKMKFTVSPEEPHIGAAHVTPIFISRIY